MTQYAATVAPIDGLKVSASYYEVSDESNKNAKQEAEGGTAVRGDGHWQSTDAEW